MAQSNGKRQNTASACAQLAAPVAQQMGLELWDVTFEKEGAGWYLRYLIDREGGVDIDQCEAFSRQVSDLLDEADPIPQSYTLEVGSPVSSASSPSPGTSSGTWAARWWSG